MLVHLSRPGLAYVFVATLIALFPIGALGEQPQVLRGQVVAVGGSYGNLETDIPIDQLSIELGESFTASCNNRTVTAISSADYADVHSGEWLGIENQAGNLQLAINFGDASATLSCRVGDSVTITF